MSKTLWIGPAGCGKTHTLLDAFEKALSSAADPLVDDLFFIVPSAEHTERVVSLLIQRGLKGFFHKRVTTLSRLANDLFRVTDIPVVSSLARTMIIRDLIRENAWDYFEGVHEQPGFPGLMGQFITELKESCVPSDVFRKRMNALKAFEPAYSAKYEALAGFYEQYEERLRRQGFRDSQDALRIHRERQKKTRSPSPKFRSIWIDGFFDFSNLQMEYLRELSSVTDDITVTLTAEDGRPNTHQSQRSGDWGGPDCRLLKEDQSQGREEAFEAVTRTRQSLEQLGFQVQAIKSKPCRAEKPALHFLQKNIFSSKVTGNVPAADPDITLLDAIGTEGEIELIARQIHKLYATGEYRYSDFAVLFRQIRHYAPVIASVFSRYEIPAEVHERDRLKFSSWIAAAASLLEIFRNGWRREDLFAFLKSGYARRFGPENEKDAEWLAEFERRSYLEGVMGAREAWLADWERGDPESLTEFNQEKKTLLTALSELEDRFLTAKTAEEHIGIFRKAVCDTFGILEVSDRYTPLTRRDAASFRRFETLLEEIRGYSVKKKDVGVSFEAFADHFLGLVELDVYSLHERDKNRVQVYDVSLARQKEYKVVFVAGLLEKVFPMQVHEDPLLSDWERKLMNGELEHPLAECLPRQHIERFFFYLAITRAKEKLFLSCPHLDFEGKESLPSFYLEEVKELFQGRVPVIRQDLSRPFPAIEEAITPRERESSAVGVLRSTGGSEAGVKALTRLAADSRSRERLRFALEPVEAKIRDPKILQGGYFETPVTSPTRLETYAKCPFRYFSDKILKLKETGEDVRVMQKGNVLHHVLQQYFDPQLKKDRSETLEQFIRREMEEGLRRNPMQWTDPYEEALDRRELFEMLLDFLRYETERLQGSSFRPAYVECSFGEQGKNAQPVLEVKDQGKIIRLRGRVDRIDTDEKKQYAVVVDYKRSAKFKTADLELGTALQLPLYLLAVREHLGLQPLGAEIYSIRDHKKSGFYCKGVAQLFDKEFSSRSQLPDELFQRVLDRAVLFVRKFAREIASGEIPVRPRDCESFCPYDTVCRVEKWRLPLFLEEIRKEDVELGYRDKPALVK
jgi:ATP-dependent helicase/nuclease subunit B